MSLFALSSTNISKLVSNRRLRRGFRICPPILKSLQGQRMAILGIVYLAASDTAAKLSERCTSDKFIAMTATAASRNLELRTQK